MSRSRFDRTKWRVCWCPAGRREANTSTKTQSHQLDSGIFDLAPSPSGRSCGGEIRSWSVRVVHYSFAVRRWPTRARRTKGTMSDPIDKLSWDDLSIIRAVGKNGAPRSGSRDAGLMAAGQRNECSGAARCWRRLPRSSLPVTATYRSQPKSHARRPESKPRAS
jgi:hypothetical protein